MVKYSAFNWSFSIVKVTVAVLSAQFSVSAKVTVKVTSPAPTNVISPVVAFTAATLASLAMQLTFPFASAVLLTVIVGATSVIITLFWLMVTFGTAWFAFSITKVPTSTFCFAW